MNYLKPIITLIIIFLSIPLIVAQEGIQLNEKAPLFEAKDQMDQTISLEKELEKGKVVILFYRGQWCPYCNRYMSALQDSLHLITQKGAKIIAITPEKNEEINKTIEKTNVSFSVIYDEGHKIMDAYDVTFTMSKTKHILYQTYGININEASGNKDLALPVPATFIISKQGIVINRHFNEDYKLRMSVKDILQSL